MRAQRELVIRGVDDDLLRRLRSASAAAGETFNVTVLRFLRDAVGVEDRLRRFRCYANWTEDDAREFDAALRAQRVMDPDASWDPDAWRVAD